MKSMTLNHHKQQLKLQAKVAALKAQIMKQPYPSPSTDPAAQRENDQAYPQTACTMSASL